MIKSHFLLELWGNVEADGTWSGLVRLAKDGTVDFVMCDLMHTYSRSQVNINYIHKRKNIPNYHCVGSSAFRTFKQIRILGL